MTKLKDKVKNAIKKSLELGVYEPGAMLPSIREIAAKTAVSRNTVQIALQEMAAEGFLIPLPNKGFRAKISENKNPKGIIGYIFLNNKYNFIPHPIAPLLKEYLSLFGNLFGYSVFEISTQMKTKTELLNEIKKLEIKGVIIDTYDEEFTQSLANRHISSIMMGSSITNKKFSTVLQDNFQGGFIAAEHLLKKGLDEFIWLGPTKNSIHAFERLGGVLASLNTQNKHIDPINFINAENDIEKMDLYMAQLETLLKKAKKPVGIFALWRNAFVAAIQTINKLDLKINQDVFIIGWTMEELPNVFQENNIKKADHSPYISWSGKTLAKCAVDYFNSYKGLIPDHPIHISISTTLVLPD